METNSLLDHIICYEYELINYLQQGYIILHSYQVDGPPLQVDEITEEAQIKKDSYYGSYQEVYSPKYKTIKSIIPKQTKFVLARKEIVKILYGAKHGP